MIANKTEFEWDPTRLPKTRRRRRIGFDATVPAAASFNLGSASDMRVLLIQKPSPRLQRALEAQGHQVDLAHTGADADRQVRTGDCDLVVLDLALLGEAGLTMVQRWRTEGAVVPVLVLSPQNAGHDKIEALDAGADALIMEPYDREEVLAQIRALSRRVVSRRGTVQMVSDLEIDPSAPMVKRGGRTIVLTPGEYDLLQYLVDNRGKVVSRSMIWEHVYGENGEITSNVIDVRIHSLRAKIDKGFDPPLILTLWGTGYMFRDDKTPDPA